MRPASHSSHGMKCKRRAALKRRSAAQRSPYRPPGRAPPCAGLPQRWHAGRPIAGWAGQMCCHDCCHGYFSLLSVGLTPLVGRCRPSMPQTSHACDPELRVRLPGLSAHFSSEAVSAMPNLCIRHFLWLGICYIMQVLIRLIARHPLLIAAHWRPCEPYLLT